METLLSYILRRLVRYATCSVSTEHTEQQSNRATEHSAGHVTHRSAVLAASRDERRRIQTFCLRPHYKDRNTLSSLNQIYFFNPNTFTLSSLQNLGLQGQKVITIRIYIDRRAKPITRTAYIVVVPPNRLSSLSQSKQSSILSNYRLNCSYSHSSLSTLSNTPKQSSNTTSLCSQSLPPLLPCSAC